MLGSKLSHYRILEPLGAGGMGVVYRARDDRLERDVAVKVLPTGALADDADRKQFRKEALTLSKLNHPNIESIYDFDSHEGIDFLVMELVPGRTLAARIAEGPMPEAEIVAVGVQLADGLAAAHRQGVLHRDIKPSNLFLTPDGRLKILDFGLAKHVRVSELSSTMSFTQGDRAVGTLPYMPPEQLRGEPVDPRSDVYAAGAVLYEMACARRAFPQGAGPAVISAILSQPPTAPREVFGGVSRNLERIILRCLEKKSSHRYAGAEELARDLRALSSPSARIAASPGRLPRRLFPVAVAGAILIGAIAVVLGLNPGGVRDRLVGRGGAIATNSLAVLPLVNLSGDPQQEYFSDGLTEELINSLAQIRSLRVIARSSVMPLKGTKDSPHRIGKRLDVDHLVEGSVLRSGDRVKVSAELIQTRTQQVLWARSYERNLEDVLDLHAEVAQAIVGEISTQLSPQEKARLARRRRVDPVAHESYLRGRYAIYARDSAAVYSGLRYLMQAVQQDSLYALGWAGVAFGHYCTSNIYVPPRVAMPLAKAAAERAIELDPGLAEGHAWAGVVYALYDWDWGAADLAFAAALELNPNLADAISLQSAAYMFQGRFEEALAGFKRMSQLDPLSDYLGLNIYCLYFSGDYAGAASATRRSLTANPGNRDLHSWLGLCALRQGNTALALEELRQGADRADHAWPIAQYGYVLGVLGKRAEALQVLEQLLNESRRRHVDDYSIALVYAGLGDRDRAFPWLERAVQARSEDVLFLHVDPAWEFVHEDPRYQGLLRRMNFQARTG